MTKRLIALAKLLTQKYGEHIPIQISLKDVQLDTSGLREESFQWIQKHKSKGYPEIAQLPDGKMFVQDGRHRILLALQEKKHSIPIKLRKYDKHLRTIWLKDADLILN